MARSEHIEVTKTGRYFIEGQLGHNTEEVWIVCHGYGYLAEFFIKHFTNLASDTCCVIAPEGLNKFYKEGMGGEVGASWMTRSDRLIEIHDYINYLDQLLEMVLAEVERDAIKLNVLGFSQGTATVCRWLTKGKVQADNLVIWAGEIPDDIDFEKFNQQFTNKPVQLVVGDNDEFISEQMLEHFVSFLRSKAINFELSRYKGGHKINEALLLEIAQGFRQS
ncbi:MAG TPA: phospholipase [Flavobacteriales bacterium]|nr:phospholipase [Flavobacteriales bacterium]